MKETGVIYFLLIMLLICPAEAPQEDQRRREFIPLNRISQMILKGEAPGQTHPLQGDNQFSRPSEQLWQKLCFFGNTDVSGISQILDPLNT